MAQPPIGGGSLLGSSVFSCGSTSSSNVISPSTSSSSSSCSSSSSSSVGTSSGHKNITLGLILHYFQAAWIIDHLRLSPENPDHQDVFENIDPYYLNFVHKFYPSSISFFGELCALKEAIQMFRSEVGDLNLSKIPQLENDYEMLYNIHLCLKQRLLSPDQIETFCAIFLSENDSIPQDDKSTAIFPQQLFDFLEGGEGDRILFMYRYSKQRGNETSPPSQLEWIYANRASLFQQLKMLKETDVYSAKFQEIEKQENAIYLLQHQCKEVDGDPLIPEKIANELKRLNDLREQLSLSVIAKEQMMENFSASIRSMEEEIANLEGRFHTIPIKADELTSGDEDLETPADGLFPRSAKVLNLSEI